MHCPAGADAFVSSYYCQDVNEASSKLVTRLTKCYEESFPLVKLSRTCANDKKWITSGIKASVKKTRSSADADNRLDAFSGQHSTIPHVTYSFLLCNSNLSLR